jgi:hypothetical protein
MSGRMAAFKPLASVPSLIHHYQPLHTPLTAKNSGGRRTNVRRN